MMHARWLTAACLPVLQKAEVQAAVRAMRGR